MHKTRISNSAAASVCNSDINRQSELLAVNSTILKGRPGTWYEYFRSRWADEVVRQTIEDCSALSGLAFRLPAAPQRTLSASGVLEDWDPDWIDVAYSIRSDAVPFPANHSTEANEILNGALTVNHKDYDISWRRSSATAEKPRCLYAQKATKCPVLTLQMQPFS